MGPTVIVTDAGYAARSDAVMVRVMFWIVLVVAPGVSAPYKAGTAALYEQMEQPCVPVATNAGYFWPRRGLYRRPGVAVVEFLQPIEPGLPKDAFMRALETQVETASDGLLREAGWAASDAQDR